MFNVCKYIYLLVQSGSLCILKLMNCKYICEWYLERVVVICCIIFDCGLSIDIFFGYYLEMEEDYQEFLFLMCECVYDFVFMFKYFECFGIYVFKYLLDDVFEEVKICWLNEIIELQNCFFVESNVCDVGKIFEVMVEGVFKCFREQFFGCIQ